jgi:hypothetical protein
MTYELRLKPMIMNGFAYVKRARKSLTLAWGLFNLPSSSGFSTNFIERERKIIGFFPG